jgi:hypothetical protein
LAGRRAGSLSWYVAWLRQPPTKARALRLSRGSLAHRTVFSTGQKRPGLVPL